MKQWNVETTGYRTATAVSRIEGETLKEAVELNFDRILALNGKTLADKRLVRAYLKYAGDGITRGSRHFVELILHASVRRSPIKNPVREMRIAIFANKEDCPEPIEIEVNDNAAC